MDKGARIILVSIFSVLFVVFLGGLFFLAATPAGSVSIALSFAAGLSMIFLPCTLPLAFIIVPLTMGQKPFKGLSMAALFGLGVSITIGFYGVAIALVGQYLGLDQATRIMFVAAGAAALLFALSELKLIHWEMPGFSGAVPAFIQKRQDLARVFMMGLFLGNAGVGCPNPAFYVLLGYIATVGSTITGAWLGFVHGVGRATPLIFLSILGILGVNATGWIVARKASVDKIVGWGLVIVGSFILTFGLFGMGWLEHSIFHEGWNNFVLSIAPNLAEVEGHEVREGFLTGLPNFVGWMFFLTTMAAIGLWYFVKEPKGEVVGDVESPAS